MNPLLEPDYSVPEQPAENPLLAAIKWKEFKAGLNALLQDPKRAAELGLVKSAVSGATLPGDVYAGREAMPLPTDMTQEQGMRVADMAGLAMSGGLAVGGPKGALGAGPIRSQKTLFDYSPEAMRRVPDVPQFNLDRYAPPRGVPERTTALADKANVKRVNEVVKKGAEMGGLEWYNTEQLLDAFKAELGAQKGAAAYSQYMDLVAATSPRSKVGENARNASYYYTLAQRGEPLPARAPDGSLVAPLPSPYGHIAQRLHVQNADNVLNNGGWPVMQNPKPASFSQNLQGNQMPVTVDTHNARLWNMVDSKGRPVDMPSNTEYGFMERLQQEQAAKMGMSPAQYQASAWVGGGAETGLKSSADPFLKVFESRVNLTAQKTGLSPEEVLKRTIRGEMPLLSAGPGPLLPALLEKDQDQQ
jgi:hypothetical protein